MSTRDRDIIADAIDAELARVGRGTLTPVDFIDQIADLVADLRGFGEITVREEVEPSLAEIEADLARLEAEHRAVIANPFPDPPSDPPVEED